MAPQKKQQLRRVGQGGLLDLMGRLLGFGTLLDVGIQLIPYVKQWLELKADWGTVEGIRGYGKIIIDAGKLVTAATPSTADDELVVKFESLLANDPLVESAAWLIARFRAQYPGGTVADFEKFIKTAEVKQSLTERATAQAITMAEIIAAVKMIMELITLLKGMFGAPAPTPTTPTTTGGGGIFDF